MANVDRGHFPRLGKLANKKTLYNMSRPFAASFLLSLDFYYRYYVIYHIVTKKFEGSRFYSKKTSI
jgi:hypothetical protein